MLIYPYYNTIDFHDYLNNNKKNISIFKTLSMCVNVVLNEVYFNENEDFSNFYDFWYHILNSSNNYCFMTYIISYDIEKKSYKSPIYGSFLKNKKSLSSFNYEISDTTLNLFKKLYKEKKEIFLTLPEFENFRLFKHFKYLIEKIIETEHVEKYDPGKLIENELELLEINREIPSNFENELLENNFDDELLENEELIEDKFIMKEENYDIKYTKRYNENLKKNKNYLIESREDFIYFLYSCYIENIEISNLNFVLKFNEISFDNWFYIMKSFIISTININHLIISEILYCYYNNKNYKKELKNLKNIDKEDKENIKKSFSYKDPLAYFINYIFEKYCEDADKNKKIIHLKNLCKIMYDKII